MALNPPLFKISLPLAPSSNHLHTVVNGRKVLSDAGRDYQGTVARAIRSQFDGSGITLKTDLCFAGVFFVPRNVLYKRDLDNFLKGTIDAIFGTFKELNWPGNDNRITQISVFKRAAKQDDNNGYCLVMLSISEGGEL